MTKKRSKKYYQANRQAVTACFVVLFIGFMTDMMVSQAVYTTAPLYFATHEYNRGFVDHRILTPLKDTLLYLFSFAVAYYFAGKYRRSFTIFVCTIFLVKGLMHFFGAWSWIL